jgi:hypothetical protein
MWDANAMRQTIYRGFEFKLPLSLRSRPAIASPKRSGIDFKKKRFALHARMVRLR